MEAWRTSCPRLPSWEVANARGFIDHINCIAAVDPLCDEDHCDVRARLGQWLAQTREQRRVMTGLETEATTRDTYL